MLLISLAFSWAKIRCLPVSFRMISPLIRSNLAIMLMTFRYSATVRTPAALSTLCLFLFTYNHH